MFADRAAAGQLIVWSRNTTKEDSVHVGIATDHGGFGLKEELVAQLARLDMKWSILVLMV